MNNYGRFLASGEFEVINPRTPANWFNTVNTATTQSYVNQIGGGSLSVKINNAYEQVISENNKLGGRAIFIKDFYSKQVWSPTGGPIPTRLENYSAIFGFTKTEIRSLSEQIEFQLTVTPSSNESFETWQLNFKNLSQEKRRLQIYLMAELGEKNTPTTVKKHADILIFNKRELPKLSKFFAVDCEIRSFETSSKNFFGEFLQLDSLNKPSLSKLTGHVNDPIAVIEIVLNLNGGGEKTVNAYCGCSNNPSSIKEIISKPKQPNIIQRNNDHILLSPDKDLNTLFNGYYWSNLQNIFGEHTLHLINALSACAFIPIEKSKKLLEKLIEKQSSDGLWENSYAITLESISSIIKFVNLAGAQFLNERIGDNSLQEHLNRAIKEVQSNIEALEVFELAKTAYLLREYSVLLEHVNHHSVAKKYQEDADNLTTRIGKLYKGGRYSKGSVTYLRDQIWPIISKSEQLEVSKNRIKKLSRAFVATAPPNIDKAFEEFNVNYIESKYNPGEYLNGGVIFSDVLDLIHCATRLNMGSYAWRLVKQMLPIYLGVNADTYLGEPFVQALGVNSKPSSSPHSAIKDSTNLSSKVYASVFENIIGLKIVNGSIKIDPCISEDWKKLEFSYKLGEASYHFRLQNPFRVSSGVDRVIVDGARIQGNVIKPFRTGTHFVEVILG